MHRGIERDYQEPQVLRHDEAQVLGPSADQDGGEPALWMHELEPCRFVEELEDLAGSRVEPGATILHLDDNFYNR